MLLPGKYLFIDVGDETILKHQRISTLLLKDDKMRAPPQEPPCFSNITTETIDEEVGSILKKSTAFQNKLVNTITPATATFANFVRPLLDDINKAKCRTVILGLFLSRNAVDPAIRQAARDAQKRIADAEAKTVLRPDIASMVAVVFEKEKDSKALDEEDRYILAHLYGQFLRSGAYIRDEAHRARLDKAQSEISELNAAAIKCFTEASNGLWFTRSELEGCPETWLTNLMTEKQENGIQDRFWVTFRDDNYIQVLQSASKEETRKRMFLGNERQFPENIERLSKAVVVRDEAARLLGYENHAALRMEDTMMRTVAKLQETLLALHSKLIPLAKAEVDALLALKKAQLKSQRGSGSVADTNVNLYAWDRAYYSRTQNRQKYALDGAKVSEYFEVNHVMSEMLKVFEELFGMEFVPMPKLDTWHETVSPFAVWDSASEGGSFLGYLFLDIFGRPGKFSSQYHSRIQPVS